MHPLVIEHLALECAGFDERGDLIRIEGPNPDTLPRVFVARDSSGDAVVFRADVPGATRRALLRLPISAFFEQREAVCEILARDAPVESIHTGRSYVFSQPPDPAVYRDVVRLDGDAVIFGIIIDGVPVSTCQSSRENDRSGEAWVQTAEAYRRRGFARMVTAAWGAHLLAQGITPYYSHVLDNLASQAVAHSLGLMAYVQDAAYE